MPRKQKPPKYRLHRASGQAIVTLTDVRTKRRRDVLLGPHGSPESQTRYAETIAAWEKNGRVVDMPARHARSSMIRSVSSVTVAVVAVEYLEHVEERYKGRRNPGRIVSVKAALKLWRSHYGRLSASQFGPLALRKLREVMIEEGWSRSTVNDRIRIIQSALEYAVSIELLRADKLAAVKAIRPLRRGEGGTEGKKVRPALETNIAAVKSHVAPQVWALIQLQLLTGARPGELVIMRPLDLDTTGRVWLYRPQFHKRDDDRERTIYIGPKAQEVIQPFLVDRPINAYLFSAKEGNAARKQNNANARRRSNQPENPRRTARRTGDHYTTNSYRKAIKRACEAADVDIWTPHQLRHNAATRIRAEFGLEAAALVLGHSSATLTDQIYAERDMSKAAAVIAKVG